ncbi:hypothetical protein Tco_1513792 [Tanacetum coccineum]
MYTVLVELSIRRIHQLNTAYQPFIANTAHYIQTVNTAYRLSDTAADSNLSYSIFDCADSKGLIEEFVTETMMEPTLGEYMEEVRANCGSNTTTPRFSENAKFKLGDEFLKILRDNAFNGTNGIT